MKRRDFLTMTAAAGMGGVVGGEAGPARIRVVMVGVGHSHAAGKMQALRGLAETYEVVGVAEADAGRRAAAAAAPAFMGVPWVEESAVLADPSVRVVVVESTLDDSPRAAMAAIRAGKHIHLDKPGAARHAEFKELREEAEERGLTVQMGYMLRYNPAIQLAFQAVRDGWLGEITEIDAAMGKWASDGQRATLAAYPGAGMFELGCHLVDTVLTMLGKPAAVHAFSQSTRPDGDGLPDNQLAVLEYPRATATLRCNHVDPHGAPRRRLSVAGTRGAITIEPLESGQGILRLSDSHGDYPKGESPIALKAPGGRYDGEFLDLAHVLRGHHPLAWTAAHDIAVHETALRAAGAWA